MAQQVIGIGAIADDGTGDPLRTALTKANANFTELYTDKAPLASPTFTGTPAAPTASGGTNTTQIATTAFVVTGFQPLDSDLTAIAALTTTSFGRALLALADAAAMRTAAGSVIGTNVQAWDAGLDAIAGATPIADGPHTVGINTITTVGGIITSIT